MTARRNVPAGLSVALARAQRRARAAADKATAARLDLARALADAQDRGYSVRDLAFELQVQPTTVQRLIAAARDAD